MALRRFRWGPAGWQVWFDWRTGASDESLVVSFSLEQGNVF